MHTLILGTTASGKTTLALRLAAQHRARGFLPLVLDPIDDPRWPTEYRFTDGAAFLACAQRATSCMLYIDEAGESVGHHQREMWWCATRSRHNGHLAHFIAQRATLISPNVRSQCSRLILFRVSRDDAEELRREWARDEIAQAAELEQGECLVIGRFGAVRRLRVFGGSQPRGNTGSGPMSPPAAPADEPSDARSADRR